MFRKKFILTVAAFCLAFSVVLSSSQRGIDAQAAEKLCMTDSGFGSKTAENTYALDLLCQPGLLQTLEIEPGQVRTFEVNLLAAQKMMAQESVSFNIHIAMQRASINLKGAGETAGTDINDATERLQDVLISNVKGETYLFTITNMGRRSAIFDVSVRPVMP
jgi:hypothetical protein